MHRLEVELRQLHASGALDDSTLQRALEIDSGHAFSVHGELRLVLYSAVAMLATGAGWLLKDNYLRIGPLALCALIALAAAACYATAVRAHLRSQSRTQAGDYLLLLGALLLSADVGYAEYQFRWLGDHWSLHLLLLAAWHGATAYLFDSRLLLSLSLSSLAAWFGISMRLPDFLGLRRGTFAFGSRALCCAGLMALWYMLDSRAGWRRSFATVLRHFALNVACWGALCWCFDPDWRWAGLALLALVVAPAIRHGLRTRDELQLVFATLYGAVGACTLAAVLSHDPLMAMSMILAIALGTATLLWSWHARMRDGAPT